MRKELDAAHTKLKEDTAKWQDKLSKIETKLQNKKLDIREGKLAHYQVLKWTRDRAKDRDEGMQKCIEDFDKQQYELNDETKDARKETAAALKSAEKYKQLAEKRLKERNDAIAQLREVKDERTILSKANKILTEAFDNLKASSVNVLELKKEYDESKKGKGGGRRWPIWVVQLICELLVNGTAPSAIPGNIKTTYQTLYGIDPVEVPCVNFVRSCRVTIQVIGETIAAIKLASADNFAQVWADATSRRQISFQALIIGLMGDDDKIDPVIISSCIFSENETSECQAESLLAKVSV